MKREIKFRAWDDYEKVFYTHINLINDDWFYDALTSTLEDEFTIEQFTGLKDKNGVEIYEGDIVERFDGEYNNAVVVWNDNGYWEISCEKEDWYYGTDQRDFNRTHKVIGNIHENPELL